MDELLHIFLHSLEESLGVFVVAFVLYILISFVEEKIAKGLGKKNRFSPIIASALGLIPQCGFSVVASDLYLKRHITMGTIIALFLACSDEALPILLSHANSKELIIEIVIIIAIKFLNFILTALSILHLLKPKHHFINTNFKIYISLYIFLCFLYI